jgi:hypothetical protein
MSIVSTKNEICLETDRIITDIILFEKLCKKGTLEALERAASLYVAPLLADEYYEWTASQQAFYEIMFYDAAERLAGSC